MDFSQDFFEDNRKLWNRMTTRHLDSEFYDQAAFAKARMSLKAPERRLLGDLSGKSLLHLQCHFGQDTISMLQLGAEQVVGIDLSDEAIAVANEMAKKWQLPAQFYQTNLYALEEKVTDHFDWVFTSYGTIVWLPDLEPWAAIIARRLKPGGSFCIVDFHPLAYCIVWENGRFGYSYFNQGGEPVIEEVRKSYVGADLGAPFREISWNHSLSEIMNALRLAGLAITDFQEYDYSPYNCFANLEERASDEWVSTIIKHKMPYLYSIVARR